MESPQGLHLAVTSEDLRRTLKMNQLDGLSPNLIFCPNWAEPVSFGNHKTAS